MSERKKTHTSYITGMVFNFWWKIVLSNIYLNLMIGTVIKIYTQFVFYSTNIYYPLSIYLLAATYLMIKVFYFKGKIPSHTKRVSHIYT